MCLEDVVPFFMFYFLISLFWNWLVFGKEVECIWKHDLKTGLGKMNVSLFLVLSSVFPGSLDDFVERRQMKKRNSIKPESYLAGGNCWRQGKQEETAGLGKSVSFCVDSTCWPSRKS